MAVKLGNPSQRRYSARKTLTQVSEINVTPMVDVMLVLLVIFMITAPLLTVGIPVDLPKTQTKTLSDPKEPLTISVDKKGLIFIQESETSLEELAARLIAITGNKTDTPIYIRGDQGIHYGRVIEVMGHVGNAGYTKVALLTEAPQKKSKKPIDSAKVHGQTPGAPAPTVPKR